MYAIGGNPEAAAVSGVNVTKYLVLVYVLAGALYGFAGALEAGRVGSATNNTGNMYEMDAIAACVVGGVSISGGIGTVPGVITGVLIFQVINYGLSFLGVSPYLQYIVKGLIIISAVAVDIRKYLKKR
jgi:methyl-galactoside transport system permease protein